MREDGFANARKLAAWKEHIKQHWDEISVESLSVPDSNSGPLEFGTTFEAEIILNIPNLIMDDLGVEILMGNKTNGDVKEITFKQALDAVEFKEGKAKYTCAFPLQNAGVHDFVFRIYPKHPDLPYQMDFPLVKWV